MYTIGRYNLTFDISAIFLTFFLLIIYFRSRERGRKQSRLFIAIIYCLHLTALLDLILVIMRNDVSRFIYPVAVTATFLSHLIHNSLAFVYMLYLIYLSRTNYLMTKKQAAILALPEAVLIIFSIVPQLQHMLYTIGTDGKYLHGSMFSFYYVIVGIYFLISLFVLLKYRRAFGDGLVYTWIFFAGNILSIILSALFPYLKATIFVQSLCALGVFITVENENTVFDKESNAMTGYALSKEAEILCSNPFESYVISLKLPNIGYYISIFGRDNVYKLMRGISSFLQHAGGRHSSTYSPAVGTFTVILYSASKEEGQRKAEEIRSRFTKKWDVPGINVVIPVQIWTTTVPGGIDDPEQLMTFAGGAYDYRIKDSIRFVDGKKTLERRQKVEEAIWRGLTNKRLNVYYQPIFDTESGKYRAAEALVRYSDEILGEIAPEEFIGVSEQMGIIDRIGDAVFEKVCAFVAEEHPEQYGIDFISVNLSAVQCMDENLSKRLTDIAKKYGANTRRINLEITSGIFSYNEEMLERAVRELRQGGFLISLDNFGEKDTDFQSLIRYPFSFIKIDRRMLWEAGKEQKKDIILKHMIGMLKELSFTVVVEGVEITEQRDELLKLNVNFLQGFLYSTPLAKDEFLWTLKDASQKQL